MLSYMEHCAELDGQAYEDKLDGLAEAAAADDAANGFSYPENVPLSGRAAATGDRHSFVVDGADVDLVCGFRWYLSGGYAVAQIAGHTVSAHRLIMGATPGERLSVNVRTGTRVRLSATEARRRGSLLVVDHINGDKLDNHRCNLRVATTQENNRNRMVRGWTSGSTGGRKRNRYMGVAGNSKLGWYACIRPGANTFFSPLCATEDEAARARDALARYHYGEFGRLNFPAEIGKPPMAGNLVHPYELAGILVWEPAEDGTRVLVLHPERAGAPS